MERKIGEIFEYNGEWYQCVVAIQGCRECSFRTQDYCTRHSECLSDARSDGISVIFKKLEKVGKPFTIEGKLYQHYKVFDIDNVCGDGFWCVHNYKAKTLTIEIKQTKEEMANTETLWYGPDKKEAKSLKLSNLKPFSLEAAKAGKPVCTRDGKKARIICFDRKFYHDGYNYPIVAMVNDNDNELVHAYTQDGLLVGNMEGELDLMMLPEKKEGWVNIYKSDNGTYYTGAIFYEKNEALVNTAEIEITTGIPRDCIDTVKINWEE